MQVKKGACKLCNSEEVVIFDEKIVEDIKSAFLVKEKWKSIQDTKEFFICPTCTYKVYLSSMIQKNFKKSKKTTRKHKQCSFCDNTGSKILFSMGDNPSNFKKHFVQFVEAIGENDKSEEILDKLVCSECLFAFVAWESLRNQVYTQLKVSNNNNNEDEKSPTVLMDDKGEEIIGKSERLRMLTPQSSGDEFQGKVIQKSPEKSPKSINPYLNLRKRKKRSLKNQTNTKKQLIPLKKLISLRKIKVKVNNDIKKDEKMFLKVPYVQIERYISTTNDQMNEVCLISDSEEGDNHLRRTPRLSPIISSINRKVLRKHLCNICDKSFLTRCDYLSHILKHEKMEDLVINLTRIDTNDLNLFENKKKSPLLTKETFNKIVGKYLGEDSILEEPSTSKYKKSRRHLNTDSSSSSSKKIFKFKINPNKNKLRLKKSFEEEEEEETDIDFDLSVINRSIENVVINDVTEIENEKNVNEGKEPLKLDDDKNETENNETENNESENNETENNEIEIICHNANDELNSDENGKDVSSLTVEVGDGFVSTESEEEKGEKEKSSNDDDLTLTEEESLKETNSEENDSDKNDSEKKNEEDENSSQNQSSDQIEEDIPVNEAEKDSNLIEEEPIKDVDSSIENEKESLTEEKANEENEKIQESEEQQDSLEDDQEKSQKTSTENSDSEDTVLNISLDNSQSETVPDDNVKSDDLDETMASEIVAFESLKCLGEAVVWINDESDKDSVPITFDEDVFTPKNNEEEEEVQENEDESVETEDEVQLSKNQPIMTNEDLLNILEESVIEKGGKDNMEMSAKRKRVNSESEDDFSSNGDNQKPRILNKRLSQNYRSNKKRKNSFIIDEVDAEIESSDESSLKELSDISDVEVSINKNLSKKRVIRDVSSDSNQSKKSKKRIYRKRIKNMRSTTEDDLESGESHQSNQTKKRNYRKRPRIENLSSDESSIDESSKKDSSQTESSKDEESSIKSLKKRNPSRSKSKRSSVIEKENSSNDNDDILPEPKRKSKKIDEDEWFASESFVENSSKEESSEMESSKDESSYVGTEKILAEVSTIITTYESESLENHPPSQPKKRTYRTRSLTRLQKTRSASDSSDESSIKSVKRTSPRRSKSKRSAVVEDENSSNDSSETESSKDSEDSSYVNTEEMLTEDLNIIITTNDSKPKKRNYRTRSRTGIQKSGSTQSEKENSSNEEDDIVNDSLVEDSESLEKESSEEEPTTSNSKIVATTNDSESPQSSQSKKKNDHKSRMRSFKSKRISVIDDSESLESDDLQSKKRSFKKVLVMDEDSNSTPRDDLLSGSDDAINFRRNNRRSVLKDTETENTENTSPPLCEVLIDGNNDESETLRGDVAINLNRNNRRSVSKDTETENAENTSPSICEVLDDGNNDESETLRSDDAINFKRNNRRSVSKDTETENAENTSPPICEIVVDGNDECQTLESDDDVIEVPLSSEPIIFVTDSSLSECSTELLDNEVFRGEFESENPSPPLITDKEMLVELNNK